MKTIESLTKRLLSNPAEQCRGHEIHRLFMPTDRYVVDFAKDFKGWHQFDTSQDAHYFGVWVNPEKLLTLTYAEGDWSLVVCKDRAEYNEQIQSMIAFFEEGFEFKTIGPEGITEYRQDRAKFLIKEAG